MQFIFHNKQVKKVTFIYILDLSVISLGAWDCAALITLFVKDVIRILSLRYEYYILSFKFS